MVAKKKSKSRKYVSPPFKGSDLKVNGKGVPLRSQAEEALQSYFETLNGHKPAQLYDLVMREVEEPLFKVVMGHVQGNQSRAAHHSRHQPRHLAQETPRVRNHRVARC